VGRNLMMLASMLDARVDSDRIAPAVEEATAIFERLGDARGLAAVRRHHGLAAQERGDVDRARALLAEALALIRRDGAPFLVSRALLVVGWVEEGCGATVAAAVHYAECLRLWDETRSRECLVDAVAGTARLVAANGQPDAAARLLGAAAALGESLGYVAPHQARTRNESAAEYTRATLGDPAFSATWEAGAALPFDVARVEAEALLAALVERIESPESPALAVPGGLTPREEDVVRLIAAGRSNREIADALFVGQSTVISHVRNIFAKLGLDSRTAVAAWAIRHGLD
jgi:DNA-binding CsgD family transcriptional regulator